MHYNFYLKHFLIRAIIKKKVERLVTLNITLPVPLFIEALLFRTLSRMTAAFLMWPAPSADGAVVHVAVAVVL